MVKFYKSYLEIVNIEDEMDFIDIDIDVETVNSNILSICLIGRFISVSESFYIEI